MVFSSTTFVFAFLPLAIAGYYVFPPRWRTIPLLASSAVFYAWGEPLLVLLIAATAVFTYAWGKFLGSREGRARTWALVPGLVVVLTPLIYLKYATVIASLVGLEDWSMPTGLTLPLGVSFYTLMALGYLIDIYRKRDGGAPSLLEFSAYLMMFPHLLAGPIVRWGHVGPQLRRPRFHPGMFGFGAFLVATGLAKKTVIADSLAPLVDGLFATGDPRSIGGAWLAAVMFTAQIYIDFSAYSDIAIGLAAMIGVHFHENFRYPYLARNAREFWRRWHISLGAWFRDYVYVPLGGSRVRPVAGWRNLMIVWALVGLWHGAAWTFLAWGVYFGVLIGLERFVWGGLLARTPRPVQHLYGLLVVILGWVLFRSTDMTQAFAYFRAMFGGAGAPAWDPLANLTLAQGWVLLVISVVLAAGVADRLVKRLRRQTMPVADGDLRSEYNAEAAPPEAITPFYAVVMFVIAAACLALATVFLVSVPSSPFVYFRF